MDNDADPDPFLFVHQALGVRVGYLEGGAEGPGYYLQAPQPEWLGRTYTAALRGARARVAEAKEESFDWIGVGRTLVSYLDMLLPGDGPAPRRAPADGADDGDELPD